MRRLVSILVVGLASRTALAQFNDCPYKGEISCGRAVTDNLTRADCFFADSTQILKNYVHFWHFDAEGGETYTFTMIAPFPLSFDELWLGVYRAADNTLLANRTGFGSDSFLIDGTVELVYTIPATGSYFVGASTNDGLGMVGEYLLSATCGTGPGPETPCSGGPITRVVSPR